MKYSLLFVVAMCIFTASIFAADVAAPDDMSLFKSNYQHIQFGRIKANRYSFEAHTLKIEVDNSASFLMKSFESVRPVRQVSFHWRSDNSPGVIDAEHETQKAGDDAVFKIGLLLRSENVIENPLLPRWMRQVRTQLKYPSENIIYLVADAKHAVGEQWVNPYNRRVTMVSMMSSVSEGGWQRASYTFNDPVEVVAIWLMADGDNTKSRFTSYVKAIRLD